MRPRQTERVIVWPVWNLLWSAPPRYRLPYSKKQKQVSADILCVRWPARVEDVGVVVVCHGRPQDETDGADGEEKLAQHCTFVWDLRPIITITEYTAVFETDWYV